MNNQQLSLFPGLLVVNTAPPSRQQRRQENSEQLGGLWRLRIATGTAIVYPGVILYAANHKRIVVCRIFNVETRWNTARLDCTWLKRDEEDYARSVPELLNDPELFLKNRTQFELGSHEVWEWKPPLRTTQAAKSVTSSSRTQQFVWEWLLYGENLKNPFNRSTLKQALESQDRLRLQNLYDLASDRVKRVAATFDEVIDQDLFDDAFWKALEALAEYQGCDAVPDQFPGVQKRLHSERVSVS